MKFWIYHLIIILIALSVYGGYYYYTDFYGDDTLVASMEMVVPETMAFSQPQPYIIVVQETERSFLETVEGVIISLTTLLNMIVGIFQLRSHRKKDLES